MSGLAIVIAFLSGVAIFKLQPGNAWRAAMMQSALVHGTVLIVATETLSLSHGILPESIQTLWYSIASVNIILLGIRLKQRRCLNRRSPKAVYLWLQSQIRFLLQLKPLEKVALLGIVGIFLICLITAVIATPNNYDSMTYHMSRVMHWIQNRSVAHYPTNILRQIAFPPGASYVLMHLQLLAGDDRWANLMQWAAFVGSVAGVSLIAKIVTGPQTQILAAFLCASLPMAMMQSTTTQNDLLVGFWLVCAVYFIVHTDRYKLNDLIWITLSFSLAIVTKSTAIIFSCPLLLWFSIRYLLTSNISDWRSLLQPLMINLTIVLGITMLSIPHFVRNFDVFGDPFVDLGTRNALIGVETVGSNLLRTICLNLPFRPIWELVENLHDWLGWDVGKVETTFRTYMHPFLPVTSWHFLLPNEGAVGSPTHLIFFAAAGVSIVKHYCKSLDRSLRFDRYRVYVQEKLKAPPAELQLLMAIIAAITIYCLLVRWQIWANRLILSLFILSTPLTASYLWDKVSRNMRWLVVCFLLMASLFYSLTPIRHPLIALSKYMTQPSQSESILTLTREQIYTSGLSNKEIVYEDYLKSVQMAVNRGCSTIGLRSGEDGLEYPLWVFLQNRMDHPVRFKHINVENESKKLKPEFPDSEICMTIEAR